MHGATQPCLCILPKTTASSQIKSTRLTRLQHVLWHSVEDVEQGLQLEVLQVHRFQRRRLEVVARREGELGFWCRRLLCPRTRERCVQNLRCVFDVCTIGVYHTMQKKGMTHHHNRQRTRLKSNRLKSNRLKYDNSRGLFQTSFRTSYMHSRIPSAFHSIPFDHTECLLCLSWTKCSASAVFSWVRTSTE